MEKTIAVIRGDGIGPEIVEQALGVLRRVEERFGHHFRYEDVWMGGCAIDRFGSSLPEEMLEKARRADAVLLGAVGGLMGAVSSGTGVVMPTLIPLAAELSGTLNISAMSLVIGVIVGTNGVVISPLSTVGGICVGCAPESVDKDKLYNQLLLAAVGFIVMSVIFSLIGVFKIFG